jgi:hypothetical protein
MTGKPIEGWIETGALNSGSTKPEPSLDQYVKNCIEYARSPIELAAHEDLWSTVAALYFLKAENPKTQNIVPNGKGVTIKKYNTVPKAVEKEISRRVWASKDVTLLNQYADFLRPDQASKSKIPYEQLEKQMELITQDIKNRNKDVYNKIDAMFDELCKYMPLLPANLRDARFIALVARVERAAEHTGYHENKNCPFEVAPADEAQHKPLADDLKYSPELHASFEAMLNKIDKSIFEFKFNDETRELADLVLQKAHLDNIENSPFCGQYKEQTKYRIKAIQKFANNYDTVLANPHNHKVRDDYAVIAAQKALRTREMSEIEFESMPEIELELVEQPKKSGFKTWFTAAATAAASVIGGLVGLDYFAKQETKPAVEAAKEPEAKPVVAQITPETAPKYTLVTAAQDITNVITKAPEAVNYVAEQTNDIAAQMARAFAEAPSILPKPAPKSDIVLDFIWDKPEVPEIELTPLTDTELKYLEDSFEEPKLELDYSKQIQREPSFDLGLQ